MSKRAVQAAKNKNELLRLQLENRMMEAALTAKPGMKAYAGSYPQTRRGRLGPVSPALDGSADAHYDPATRKTLRRDCQALLRSNPAARAMVRAMAVSVVGDDILADPQTQNDAFNARARELWRDWFSDHGAVHLDGEQVDYRRQNTGAALLHAAVSAWATDGDWLAVMVEDGDGGGSVQVVETERLVSITMNNGRAVSARDYDNYVPGVGGCIGGVELDGNGRVLGYYAAPWDSRGSIDYGKEPAKIDAEWGTLLKNPLLPRPNMTRGEPALASTLARFEQLDKLSESVRMAFLIAACFGLIHKTASPAAAQLYFPGQDAEQPIDGTTGPTRQVDFQPGMVVHAPQNESYEQIKPEHPSQQYNQFRLSELMEIGADLGVPALLALMDPTKTNYSGFRAMLALAYSNVYIQRRALETVLSKWYRWCLDRWIADGRFRDVQIPANYRSVRWTFNPLPVLDPGAEVSAIADAIRNGLMTPEEGVASLGGSDFAEHIGKLKTQMAQVADAGVQLYGQQQAPQQGQQQTIQQPLENPDAPTV